MSINTTNEVESYGVNGNDYPPGTLRSNKKCITVRQGRRRTMIRVNIGEIELTVIADDLIRAIENAQNANK